MMDYNTIAQAITKQGIRSNSLMMTHSPSLENKMGSTMASMHIPSSRKLWTNQVTLDPRTRFTVLTPSHCINIIHSVVILSGPETKGITDIACSGDGISGQFVQFSPTLLTNVTVSMASEEDMKALDLTDLGITPTECKDHLD